MTRYRRTEITLTLPDYASCAFRRIVDDGTDEDQRRLIVQITKAITKVSNATPERDLAEKPLCDQADLTARQTEQGSPT